MSITAAAPHHGVHGVALVRVTAVVVSVALLTVWVIGLVLYAQDGLAHPATGDSGITDDWLLRHLGAVGVDPAWYVAFRLVLEVVLMGTAIVSAGLLLRVSEITAFQPYLAVVLIAAVVVPGVSGYTFLVRLTGSADVAVIAASSSVMLFLPALFLFPTGRFVPGWGRYPAILAGIAAVAVWGVPVEHAAVRDAILAVIVLVVVACAGVAQVIRLRRADAVERQQTKWVALAVSARIVYVLLLLTVLPSLRTALPAEGVLALSCMTTTVSYLLSAVLAVAVAVAMRRHGLFAVDGWISRSLAAGMLAVGVAAAYVLATGGLGLVWPTGGIAVAVIVTAVFSAALLPVYRLALRVTNRLVFGREEDPYRLVTNLAARLAAAPQDSEVAHVIVTTVATALRPAAVSLTIRGAPSAAEWRQDAPVQEPQCIPITDRGEQLGLLSITPRKGLPLRPRDLELLHGIVAQAAPALAATSLAAELQQAQRRAIESADAERAKLHRELHDGIAPTLASVYQRIELAGTRPRPSYQAELLEDAKTELMQSLTDIRGMVLSLRTPMLDELGLAEAVRRRLLTLPATSPRVRVTAKITSEPPADLAEAAFWMILEAVANARRHSGATDCLVQIANGDGCLTVVIHDDGNGAVKTGSDGGVRMMRERIESIGGDFDLHGRPGVGTTITARLWHSGRKS